MSLFGGKTQASTQTVASGVTIQTSIYGSVVPVLYGQTRLTGNLIWYGAFQAIAPSSSGGGKGGGGSSGKNGGSSTDYKASFAFALAEGTLGGVSNVWSSKSETAFGASGLAFANGALAQPPWGYLTTYFAGQDLSYAGTGYVFAAAYDLGNSAQLPNLSYEVTGLFANAISGLPDADPRDIVVDVLTNLRYGIGFPSARLGDLSLFSAYCRAAGMVVSPLFDTQQDAASQVNQIVQDCNAEFVWSGAKLTIVPYGDQNLSANGATYIAPSAPLYSLTDDDFLDNGQDSANGGDPVQCSRARPSDRMNSVKLEWLNRANQYNIEIVEADDQAAIETYGLRTAQPSQSHWFCDHNAATMSATLQLQRQAVRNQYSFTLGWRYCLLDPMDIVEVTDAGLGLANQWVRIVSLEEDDNGNLKVTAEEVLDGTGSAPLYNYQSGSPFIADYNGAPGPVNTPLIFEPPPSMLAANAITAPQVIIGASGGANWGGCDVWLSLDGSTYRRMGRINGRARQGVLHAALAAGSDPDTTSTLSVDLTESGGALLSGTLADADAFRTLCYADGELVAYETATLTGTNLYSLTTLRRGVYGTSIAAHAAGAEFCRLDDSVMSFDLPVSPVSYVGQTLYLKFLSFNLYGGGQEQLANVSAYTYNPNGVATFVAPPSGVSFTVGAEQQADGSWNSFGVVAWTASPDPLFDQYEVQYRLHAGPGPWISWRGGPNTTSFRISPLPPDTAYDVQVRAVRSSGPFTSAWAQDLNVTTVGKTTSPPAPTALSAVGGYRQITLDWTASAENDIAWYEIWEGGDSSLSSASRIGLITGTHYVRPGLNLSETLYYWVRAQDTSGNVSTYLGPGEATTLGVDSTDITGQIVQAQIAANAVTASNLIAGLNLVQVVPAITDANHATSLFAYDTSDSQLYTWNGGTWVVPAASVAAGSIGLADFASGIAPVQIVGALPGAAAEGDVAVLTADGQLYRYHSGAWSAAVPAANVTGTLTESQIESIETAQLTGQITTTQIAAGAVTTPLLGAGAVETANLAAGAVTAETIAADAITGAKIAGGTITGSNIAGETITGANIAADSITTGLIAAGAVTATQIAAGTITATQIAAGTITAAQIEAGGITGSNIAGETITGNNIAGLTITGANLVGGTITGDKVTGNFIQGNAFSASDGSNGFITVEGTVVTIDSLDYGPDVRAVDGTGQNRVAIGQQGGAWGLWVWKADGTLIFEEDSLASGVVQTYNIAPNNVTYPYGVTVASGTGIASSGSWTTLWSHNADVTGTIQVLAQGIFDSSGISTGSSDSIDIQILINGSAVGDTGDIYSQPADGGGDTGTWGAGLAISASVTAGQTILVRAECESGGARVVSCTITALIVQR